MSFTTNEKLGDAKYLHEEAVSSKDGVGLHATHSTDPILEEYSEHEIKKIVHRVDRRLVTMVGIMYCISLMDRTNLGAAAIAGMNKELHMVKNMRYSIITLVFFTTYTVFQFPSTIIIRYLGPRNHLAGITLLWGACMIGMGFVKSWTSLAALRVILGLLEAGFFPGAVYLLSTWYCRFEMAKRYSVFYLLGSAASACSGILAYGFMQLNGRQGLAGWRWIFILEGVITCAIAIVGWFFLVGFPDDGKTYRGFLSQRETQVMIARVNRDRGDAKGEPFSVKRFLGAGADPKIWGFAMIFCMTTTVTYALAYFLPIILRSQMGFSIGASQCLVAPPYIAAGIMMFASGWFGDKYHIRGPVVAFNALLAIVGVCIMGFVKSVGARYFGVFLVCMGANSNIPAVMTYQANNIRGHWKRAFCSATLVGAGGIGGIIGSLVFREKDAPAYHPGLYAAIVSQVIILIIVGLLSMAFKAANKKADRGERVIEGAEDGFRYTI